MDKNTIGKNIRKHRKAAKMNQTELAEKAEISLTAMSDIERGTYKPASDTLRRISLALKIPMDDFFKSVKQ